MFFPHDRTALMLTLGLSLALPLLSAAAARAEDGYRLWLRYDPLPARALRTDRLHVAALLVPGHSATDEAIRAELTDGCSGLLNRPVPVVDRVNREGVVVAGTPAASPLIAGLGWGRELAALGPEGFRIHSVRLNGHAATVIASGGEIGALYGAFHFLRMLQTLQPLGDLDVRQKPKLRLRVLDHWDNLDGSIERGYAGRSLWDWPALPDRVDPRLRDYARANASVGINGAVLNNVNARAQSLSAEYLRKTAAIAAAFRPYGVKVYLSARFSAPIELGGLETADPLAPEVGAWWKRKADEIYALIPDFGGFLVKADSEGQPGPRTYHRSHADGANMLAAALAPHHGVVMWRAFVYDPKPGTDRAAAAYESLHPFDGQFAPNVLLQVKNGPIDFQPREPFHPLFGAMPKTQVMPELQITQEYLGFSNHLVFLAPMWSEFLQSDTGAEPRPGTPRSEGDGSGTPRMVDENRSPTGPGTRTVRERSLDESRAANVRERSHATVARVVDGSLYGQPLTGIAGVANTGSDRNWTGHDFAQANWYAFGRLAWDPDLTPHQIAREWVTMTFTHDRRAAAAITRIMLGSHEAAVDYMMPLGLHHIMWPGSHYGPAPWWDRDVRPDWNSTYYHHADARGLGFDRTATGSNAVSQYQPPVRDRFASLRTCPEKFLLWFHHVPWDYRLHSGRTLWDALALHYQRGVDWVRATRREWDALSGAIDPERHGAVAKKLAIQERDAVRWRDAVLLYFQTFSKRPLPPGVEKPQHSLAEYEAKGLTP